jgi:hypothetical protein
VSSAHRLVDPELPRKVIRRFHLTLLTGPVAFSILMMGLIWVGIGRLVNPLVLGYLLMVGYILLGVFEGWEPRSERREGGRMAEDVVSAKERREDSEHTRG